MKKIYIPLGILLTLVIIGFLGYGWLHFWLDEIPKPVIHDSVDHDFEGDVIIVGAGASGLAAAKLLEKYDISYTIIEATDQYGGRIQQDTSLADFPIDTGAEWIHERPDMLGKLLGESGDLGIDTFPYWLRTVYEWDGEELYTNNAFLRALTFWSYPEYKFVDSTWFQYLDTYFARDVQDNIIFSNPVTHIEIQDHKVLTTTSSGKVHESDKLILTVPIGVLQKNYITFAPKLSQEKREAIDSVEFLPGIKAFLKFDEKFYPDAVFVDTPNGEATCYDAALGKESSDNILGILITGAGAQYIYEAAGSKDSIVDYFLEELDLMFDGAASESFSGEFIIKDWGRAIFTRGTWTSNSEEYDFLEALASPISDKVYFAGETYNQTGHRSTVHGAILSGYKAVYDMLGVSYD